DECLDRRVRLRHAELPRLRRLSEGDTRKRDAVEPKYRQAGRAAHPTHVWSSSLDCRRSVSARCSQCTGAAAARFPPAAWQSANRPPESGAQATPTPFGLTTRSAATQ